MDYIENLEKFRLQKISIDGNFLRWKFSSMDGWMDEKVEKLLKPFNIMLSNKSTNTLRR